MWQSLPPLALHPFDAFARGAQCLAPSRCAGYAEDSLWAGTLLARRIETGWGMANLAEATRYLIMEAFRDPLNQRFVLLSESDIPLYDPLTLYSQIMWEHRSRINTLPGPNLDPGRWTPRMEVSGGPRLGSCSALGGLPNSPGQPFASSAHSEMRLPVCLPAVA